MYVTSFLFQIFTQFGSPTILQSDNGKEFVALIIRDLVGMWSETRIINGRPRYPQSQGLIERANGTLDVKLSTWIEDNNREDWSAGLPLAICKYCLND